MVELEGVLDHKMVSWLLWIINFMWLCWSLKMEKLDLLYNQTMQMYIFVLCNNDLFF